MKKFTTLLATSIAIVVVAIGFSFKNYYPTGAPAGHTGSPADGKNCTACHGGTAGTATDFISSDIPAEGYTPGTTYNFTVTVSGSGKKGFQVSPQDASGNLIGTLIAQSGTQLTGNNKYVTHNPAVTTDPAEFHFQWTAPDPGVGDVTFYGAIVASKPNVKVGTYTVSQASTSSIEKILSSSSIKIYPNPVQDVMNISLPETFSNFSVSVMTMEGKRIYHSSFNGQSSLSIPVDWRKGMYLVEIQYNNRYFHKTVQVQ